MDRSSWSTVGCLLALLLSWVMGHLCLASPAGESAGPIEIVPQIGHNTTVHAVAISDDGTLGLSGDTGGRIKLWDLEANLLLRDLHGHTFTVSGLTFLPGGLQAVSSSWDGTLRLWDLPTGRPLHVFEDEGVWIRSVVVTTGGRYAFTRDKDGVVIQWDLEARSRVRRIALEGAEITAIAAIDGGETLLYASRPETGVKTTLTALDPASGENVRVLGTTKDSIYWMSVQGDRVVAGHLKNVIQIFDVNSGRRLRRFELEDGFDTYFAHLTPDRKHLLAATNYYSLRIQNAANGRDVDHIDGHEDSVRSIAISPDGTHALTGAEDATVIHWDVEARGIIQTFRQVRDRSIVGLRLDGGTAQAVTHGGRLLQWDLRRGELESVRRFAHGDLACAAISPDGRILLSPGFGDGEHRVLEDGEISGHRSLGESSQFDEHDCPMLFSDDSRLAMTAGLDGGYTALDRAGLGGNPEVFDLETLEQLTRKFGTGRLAVATAFLPGGEQLLSWTRDNELEVWDLATEETLRTLGSPDGAFTVTLDVTSDGRLAVTGGPEGTVTFWDVRGGKRLRDLPGERFSVRQVRFSPDDRWLAVTSGTDADGASFAVELWDQRGETLLAQLDGLTSDVREFAFSADHRHLLLAESGSSILRLWQMSTGHVMSMVADGEAWAIYSSDGYFDTSRRGIGLVAAVDGLHAYRADHAGLGLNRPDRVLKSVRIGDPEAIAHFRAVHRWREDRHGLTEGAIHAAPTARILDAPLKGSIVQLTFTLASVDAELASYRIYVNDVPVNGSVGTPIQGAEVEATERVELAPGRSKVEIEAVDARGVASMRPHRLFELERPSAITGDLYFLGFGVSRYRDSRLDLGYAHKDAQDLTRLLGFADGAFDEVYLRAYVDEEVTAESIRDARKHLERARVEDTVVVFVAGHGVYAGADGSVYYFLTHDTDLERIEDTAASFELFEELLDGIAPRRKLFLIDTCESGERSDVELAARETGKDVEGARARTTRGLIVEREETTPPMRRYRIDQSRLIYSDLVRRTGAIVISSSRGSELSYERDDLENGVFTEEILNALLSDVADSDHDGLLTTEELRAYITGAVAALTGDLQHPTVDRDNLEQVFALPLVTNATLD